MGSCRQRTPHRHTHGNWLDTEITHLIIWKTHCLGLSHSDPAKAKGSSMLFKRLSSLLPRRCVKFHPAVLAVLTYFTRKRGKTVCPVVVFHAREKSVFLTRCLVDTEDPHVRGTSRFLFRDPSPPRASSISSTSLHLPRGWGPGQDLDPSFLRKVMFSPILLASLFPNTEVTDLQDSAFLH